MQEKQELRIAALERDKQALEMNLHNKNEIVKDHRDKIQEQSTILQNMEKERSKEAAEVQILTSQLEEKENACKDHLKLQEREKILKIAVRLLNIKSEEIAFLKNELKDLRCWVQQFQPNTYKGKSYGLEYTTCSVKMLQPNNQPQAGQKVEEQ